MNVVSAPRMEFSRDVLVYKDDRLIRRLMIRIRGIYDKSPGPFLAVTPRTKRELVHLWRRLDARCLELESM